jgi:Na+/H+-dicarboxylate symporter
MNFAQRWILVVTLVVVGWALAVAFVPLPSQGTFNGAPATCGPGSTSASALYVKMFPDSVVSTDGQSLTQDQAAEAHAFIRQCQGVADDRLWTVVAVVIFAAIVGAVATVVLGIAPKRQPAPST